ncbi:MAG: hypothetical protein IPM74_11115 [Crocinitomicaceae bacterium]|nr:hypothetical protein [Crocinitomicaceae bacterium]MBK8926432.1 hypothetical protein [Crocinitomicaceae bacterium]
MTTFFLKAKHWQLFILLLGIPLIFQVVMMVSFFSEVSHHVPGKPISLFKYFKYFPIFMTIFTAVFFGWFWSVAIGLQKKIPQQIKMNVLRFKIFFFIPLIYMIIFLLLISNLFNEVMTHARSSGLAQAGGLVALILPLHLLSMFGIFHSLFFLAKTLKTAELQREVKFEDFASEFFLLWFYPIGVWIVQPKINKLVKE